ncbi:MAG: NAD(P)(+) transhydrogenase (Re/Si-specific) subunit beta [Deltaproteobacteria bacterium]|nr:NAD(P)(+) transhydrogenase (Re/Si-specific) subunit beta [Deltaproteobacteria bacterium]
MTSSSTGLLLDLAIVLILLAAFWQFRTPGGAKRGTLTAVMALACALVLVLVRNLILDSVIVMGAVTVGSAIGLLVALRVNMIQIPAMIAFQHGAGGIAAFLVSYVELARGAGQMALLNEVSGLVGTVVGAATFSGSMIASGKLANRIRQTPLVLDRHGWWLLGNGALVVALALAVLGMAPGASGIRYELMALIVLSASFGVLFSIRIGGADMPVLISFLNATAGLAAAFCGIVIENRLLIACGACVAASGSILTHVMCRAMNRSLPGVFLFSKRRTLQAAPGRAAGNTHAAAPTAERSPEDRLADVVAALKEARRVVIIPGYGMALAQAQFGVVSLATRLIGMGKEVKFAIHPVAGRMPGHMNVLLAEADVDYELLREMDEVNPEFSQTDLALVIGACDVVNPAAIHVEGTPISGMPILLAHEAKRVAVFNLDARPGYSGVENPLYRNDNTIMLLGDAKKTMDKILERLGQQ